MEHNQQQLDELAPPASSIDQLAGTLPNGEVDNEGAMAKADLFKLSNYSYKLFKKLEDNQQLEAWVQAKITKAADYIASVYHYLEYEMKFSEYGAKLENSEMYTESEKAEIRNKLLEAKETLRALKIAQAEKLSEGKKSKPDFLDVDKDGDEKEPFKKAIKDKKTSEEEVCESNPSTKKPSKQEKKAPKEKSRKDYDSDEDYYHDYPEAMPDSYAKPHERVAEGKPSAGLTKKEKSAVVKKAKAGKDIGKKGKGFKDVAAKAAKTYGSKEKGEKVAAAAMWKNIKESVERTVEEGMFSTSPEEYAKTDPTMAELLKLQKQYQGTEWAKQIEDRIQYLVNRYETGYQAPQDTHGEPVKVLPPDAWAKKYPNGIKEDASDDAYWGTTPEEKAYFDFGGSKPAAQAAPGGKGIMKMSDAEFKRAKERLPFLFQEPSPEDEKRSNAVKDAANQQFINSINNMGNKNAPSVSDPDAMIKQQQNLNKAYGTGSSDEAYRKNVDSSFRESAELASIKKLSGL